jgi:hypothetical protein
MHSYTLRTDRKPSATAAAAAAMHVPRKRTLSDLRRDDAKMQQTANGHATPPPPPAKPAGAAKAKKRQCKQKAQPSEAVALVFFNSNGASEPPAPSGGCCVYVRQDHCTGAYESALYADAAAAKPGTPLVPLLFFAVDRCGGRVVLEREGLKALFVDRFGQSMTQYMELSHFQLQDRVYELCRANMTAGEQWPDVRVYADMDPLAPALGSGAIPTDMHVTRVLAYSPVLLPRAPDSAPCPAYSSAVPRIKPASAADQRSVVVVVQQHIHVIRESDVPLELRREFDWLCSGVATFPENRPRLLSALAWTSFFRPVIHTDEQALDARIDMLMRRAFAVARAPAAARDEEHTQRAYKRFLQRQTLFDCAASPIDKLWQLFRAMDRDRPGRAPPFWLGAPAAHDRPSTADSGTIPPASAVLLLDSAPAQK